MQLKEPPFVPGTRNGTTCRPKKTIRSLWLKSRIDRYLYSAGVIFLAFRAHFGYDTHYGIKRKYSLVQKLGGTDEQVLLRKMASIRI